MDRVILQGIYQVLKDMVEKQQENQEALLSSLNEVKAAVANIKISADSINLNTDTLEAKLDTVNTAINNAIITIGGKQDIAATKLDTINTSITTLNDTLTNPGSEDNQNIVYWLQTIDTRLSNVGTEVAVQSGYLASIVNNTEGSEGSGETTTTDLSELKTAIQQTTAAVLDTKGSVDTILNDVNTIVTNTTNANSKLDSIITNTTPASEEPAS